MKKVFALFAILLVFGMGMTNVFAQEDENVETTTSAVTTANDTATETVIVNETEEAQGFHKMLKQRVIEGGPGYMGAVLLCLIFGLALAIERIIYLNLADTNTKKLLEEVESAIQKGGIESAKDVCRNTRGPVASIFYQGLSRYDEGVEVVEKTVASYGGVQTGLMERGLPWISLFIGIAPMLGFLGTVIGMIEAFDRIQQAGDLSATVVAGGIKIALLTTVAGLIVGIILQIFYNYIISKVDAIVGDMEDASISLLDIVVKHNLKSK